jgi:mono/diheme cytochrome c family protein
MMKSFVAISACLLVSCSTHTLPQVTSDMAREYAGGSMTNLQLQKGRVLFASRCIECHTLPPVNGHTDSEWPHLVDAMASRASLKPSEREALLAYILAARQHQ